MLNFYIYNFFLDISSCFYNFFVRSELIFATDFQLSILKTVIPSQKHHSSKIYLHISSKNVKKSKKLPSHRFSIKEDKKEIKNKTHFRL